MLRIYDVIVSFLGNLRPVIEQIGKYDRDLADQARRAGASIALNTAEGSGAQGGNRRVRYQTALGSAREVRACLHVASAYGYVEQVAHAPLSQLDHIIATLVKVVR